ncbi:dehydrogenase/reductase SDR family member 13b.1 [Megalobrama amblycephala]|uniref:dehydrogenase/reductase SDR family member 13b.1 n=1 Tax=Megalobrama amblycephala TaxID=75352 RepID=UPI0020147FD8|nr:dehydrogenase/reductase SDR family member 13b.1 [Megalobrama amblycephala]
MSEELLLIAGVVIGVLIIFRTYVRGARCKSKEKLHGKTVIVTGSNTGIGRATAVDLARRGARVILACRNQTRGEAAAAVVQSESGSKNVVYMQLDLASLKSVRSFAETFLRTERRLDILINNAGVYMQGTTEDGLGLMFGINHLGHFLLTNLLLDRLKQCSPSRIVTVSSYLHNYGNLDFDTLRTHKEFGVGESSRDVFRIYSHSKLCNVLFTHELAKRLQGTHVTCYSLHPGVINSDLGRNMNKMSRKLLKPIVALFFKDVEAGAQTTLYCAVQEGIEALSGRYFSNCAVKKLKAKAQDDAVAKKLWEVSETLSGLS